MAQDTKRDKSHIQRAPNSPIRVPTQDGWPSQPKRDKHESNNDVSDTLESPRKVNPDKTGKK